MKLLKCDICKKRCTGKYQGFRPKTKYSKKLIAKPLCRRDGLIVGTRDPREISRMLGEIDPLMQDWDAMLDYLDRPL